MRQSLVPREEMRRRLVPAWGDEAFTRPTRGDDTSPRSYAGRRGVASFLHGETPVLTPPSSRRSTYRYPVKPIRTARTGQYSSKWKTLKRVI
ncbi:hypothetical protein BHE74_00044423 [Ensete ventricosum]|nr:hypothetical protein BHE74_00044423 [Ensete ventricosum]